MLAFLLAFCCACSVYATDPSLVAQGDAAYARRTDLEQAKAALMYYQKAMAADPKNPEPRWKASRTAWWVADHEVSRKEKLALLQSGIAYAQEAVTLDPNSVEGHFWLGGNYGTFGETKGVMKSLALVKPIRQEMAAVIRINDHFLGGAGYRVLGTVDYKVPGIAGGSKKRALEELNRALAIDPQDPFTHFYLAEYFKTIGEKDKMRSEWTTLKSLNVSDSDKPEHQMLLEKGRRLFDE